MSRTTRMATWCGLVLTLLASGTGCYFFSPSQNPAQLWWGAIPNGGIYETHAKPAGKGYYANFDPYACRVEVRPKTYTQPVGGLQVYIATVYDNQGNARRGRRVEWYVEGKGNIIEVDEGGLHPDRGYKVTEKYGVSYTSYFEHEFDRGNADPSDDFVQRPGQTFCIVSSPVDGETKVTAYVPAIHDMDKNRVTVTTFWLDAAWRVPVPQQARKQAQLITKVFKNSDSQPLQGYRVRYRVLDGSTAPAVFVNSGAAEAEAISDPLGNAVVTLRQLNREPGITRIGVELIRPPDMGAVTGTGIVVLRGETQVEWVGSGLTLSKIGPPAVSVNSDFDYQLTVTNTSRSPSDALTIEDDLPPGLQFVSAVPPPVATDGNRLVWTQLPLPPGGSAAINLKVRATRPGQYNNKARVVDADRTVGAEAFFTTNATSPGLRLNVSGPQTAFVNGDVTFNISVENTGDAPATNVIVSNEFDDGFVFYYQGQPRAERKAQLEPITLQPREVRPLPLVLRATKPGTLQLRVVATADGALRDEASAQVNVTRLGLGLQQRGPQVRYVRGKFIWEILVQNTNDQPIDNVVIRDQLPPQVTLVRAYDNGQQQGNEVVWNLGRIEAQGLRRLRVEVEAQNVTPKTTNLVTATYGPNLQERSELDIELRGIPALLMLAEQTDRKGTINVGDTTSYAVSFNNTGSAKVGRLVLRVKTSTELKVLRAVGPDGKPALVQGDLLIFQQIDDLLPSQTINYTLELEGVAAGDGRLHLEYVSDLTGRDPVKDTEMITVTK
jgi:uncharacterized repeat protein (TIGR01451 family)